MPHGGPASRDDGDFDWWAAFLVSRGYAVFQPEFRGSEGFGEAFLKAGDGEWGGKMQTDIMDGVNYLAKEGTIDPSRMCIIGASYGGFAALQNLVQFPGAYRCGVSVNGVTDPGQLVSEVMSRSGSDSGSVDYLRKILGLNERLTVTAAPARHVDEITAPVMLIYSDKDARVPPIQSQHMAKVLQDAGKPVEVVVLPGDDHFLLASASRVKMLQAIDGFLAKNLPVKP
jgi:dipeptidyl aminopeptidase/acylaminoacyl peptidase